MKKAAITARSVVAKNFILFSATDGFRKLNYDSVVDILNADNLEVHGDEMQVFKAACIWIKSNQPNQEQIDAILKCPDYRNIPEEKLMDEVFPNSVVRSGKTISKHIGDILILYHSTLTRQPVPL